MLSLVALARGVSVDPGYKGLAILIVGSAAAFAIWRSDGALVEQRDRDRSAQSIGFSSNDDMERAKGQGFADAALWREEVSRREAAALAERNKREAAEAARKKEEDRQRSVRESRFQEALIYARVLKKSMKNPDSFKLETVIRTPVGIFCYEYRATNSFNAVVPGKAFVGAGKSGTSDSGPSFAGQWNKHCATSGERLDTVAYAINNGY